MVRWKLERRHQVRLSFDCPLILLEGKNVLIGIASPSQSPVKGVQAPPQMLIIDLS